MLPPGSPCRLTAACVAALLLQWATPGEAGAQLPDAPPPPAPPAAGAPEAPDTAGQPPDAAPPTADAEMNTGAEPAPVPPPPSASTAPEPEAPPPAPPAGYLPHPTYPELSPPPGGYDEAQPQYGYPPRDGVRIPVRIAARLRTLETDLNLLAARGGGRVADGVISLVAGGAFFTIGAFIEDPLFRSLLFMTGGVATGRGLVDLLVVPDPEDYAIEYAHMPMASVEQVRERLGYGEEALSMLAQRSRIARMINGSIAIASGAVTIAVYVARPPCPSFDPECRFRDDPINYVVVVGGGISVIGGLVSIFVRSEAERRWDAYTKLRARLHEEGEDEGGGAQAPGSPVDFALPSVAPMRGGAVLSWGMRF